MQAVISIRNRPAGTSRPVCFRGKLRGLENDAEKVESRSSEKISSSKTLFVKFAALDAMNRRRAALSKRENPNRALVIVLA
jgi:hypothetical protein